MPRERGDGAVTRLADPIAALEANVARVIRGKPTAIRHAVVALLARGHLLIEDVPGVGKTTLARALATSIGGTFHRIQFTSDLLPSDIVGVSVLDAEDRAVRVPPGRDLREPRPGRRDQPHDAANPERAARGDERRPGLGRRPDARAREPVHGGRDPEPGGALRDLPAARVADGPLPAAHPHGLPVARGREPHPARIAGARRPTRWPRSRAGAARRPTCARCRRPPTACTSSPSWPTTSWRSRARPGGRRTWRWGSRRAAQLAWRNAARAAALCDGRDYVLPDDLKTLARPALAHRVVVAGRDDALGRARQDAERVLLDILDRVPAPG